jgi:hypothetical protein
MTETMSQSRQTADIAFGKAKSQFEARQRAFDELDLVVVARDEKTVRLREARLAKEAEERRSLLSAKSSKPAKTKTRTAPKSLG